MVVRREPVLRAIVAAALAVTAAVLIGALRVRNLPLDDAYIHLSYGIDFSWKTIFSFQGGHRDTGTSSWIWTAICIVVARLHLPEHATLTALSIAIFASVLWRIMDVVDRALPPETRLRRVWPYVAALLLAIGGNVVWLSLTGMETGLSVLLLLTVVPRVLDGGMTTGTAILAAIALWTRIESVIWLAAAAALLPFTGPRDRRLPWRGWLVPIGALLVYLAYNRAVSGHLLPTTALAKRASFVPGGHSFKDERDFVVSLTHNYLRPWIPGWLVAFGAVMIAGGVSIALNARRFLRERPRLDPGMAAVIALVGAALVHIVVNVVGFRSSYHHMRYFAPALYLLPALSLVLLTGAAREIAARIFPRVRRPRIGLALRWMEVWLPAITAAAALIMEGRTFGPWAKLYVNNAEQVGAVHMAVGRWLREAMPDAKRVATFDIGTIRWASHLGIADLGGVVDAEALRYLQTRKQADFVRDTHAEVYVSIENGWDFIPPSQPTYELVPIKSFQFREYFDPFPPHSKRMVVFRVNHCGEPRVVRREVGASLSFDFDPGDARARSLAGIAQGSSFARWPVNAKDLKRAIGQANGRFLASDANDLRDRATGRFETVPMKAEGEWLSFRIAGGYDPARLRVELRSEGQALATWTGFDADAFLEVLHPLGALRGRTFTLALIDEATGRWGHLMIDDVKQFTWAEAPPKPCPKRR